MKRTATGISYRDDNLKEKLMPPVTLCPLPGFRKRGFYFDKKTLDENTFTWEDVFSASALKSLRNKQSYKITEISNYYIGKCFMIR